jgi:hypothetical protein
MASKQLGRRFKRGSNTSRPSPVLKFKPLLDMEMTILSCFNAVIAMRGVSD